MRLAKHVRFSIGVAFRDSVVTSLNDEKHKVTIHQDDVAGGVWLDGGDKEDCVIFVPNTQINHVKVYKPSNKATGKVERN